MYISPEYRGTTISSPSYALVSRTVDTRIPQSQWNLDKCNGTGPSGYTIDLTRMQMLYMDYSWYGAGVVRWGLRTTNGQIIYCHQQINNNRQFEAYLRSGNMPAHYESNGIVGYSAVVPSTNSYYAGNVGTSISAGITTTDTTIPFSGASSYFNIQGGVGTIGSGATLEYFSYAGATSTALTGVVRGILGTTPRAAATGTLCYNNSIPLVNTYGFNPNGGSVNISNPGVSVAINTTTYTGIFGSYLYGITGGF